MTIVYVPRLIESVEQAEALPVGTVAHRAVIGGPARYAATRTPSNDWYIGGREFQDHDFMVGWTALVPVEAEEEQRSVARHSGGGQTNYNTEAAGNPGRMGEYIASLPVESRFVTPWEAV